MGMAFSCRPVGVRLVYIDVCGRRRFVRVRAVDVLDFTLGGVSRRCGLHADSSPISTHPMALLIWDRVGVYRH